MKTIIKLFATGFGAGYSPKAPGTCGTIVGVLLFWALSGLATTHYFVFVAVFVIFAVWAADKTLSTLRVDNGYDGDDPQEIVIDEIAGFLVTMIGQSWNWKAAVIGFVLFRFFDVVKPFPIRRLEKLKGGLGIVMDDVMAGVYSAIVLGLVLKLGARL